MRTRVTAGAAGTGAGTLADGTGTVVASGTFRAAATTRFERGWRAYVADDRTLEIVCPACAERERGEDEST